MSGMDGVSALTDRWARDFFEAMLGESLSNDAFENAIRTHLSTAGFVFRAPEAASWIRALIDSLGNEQDAGYAGNGIRAGARFKSHWLVGKVGLPGAVHIGAPPEQAARPRLSELNRPLHRHDTGRIGLITSGEAVFHFVARDTEGSHFVIDCPVSPGDLIFWPAWTPHTFDALAGFSLLSAMASYVSPKEDGFVYPLDTAMADPDSMPRVSIDEFSERELAIACQRS